MGVPEVLDVARDAIFTLLLIASPIMGVGLAVGLTIALIQALTSIQEMTLVFVPKIFAIFLALLVFMPYMIQNGGGGLDHCLDPSPDVDPGNDPGVRAEDFCHHALHDSKFDLIHGPDRPAHRQFILIPGVRDRTVPMTVLQVSSARRLARRHKGAGQGPCGGAGPKGPARQSGVPSHPEFGC